MLPLLPSLRVSPVRLTVLPVPACRSAKAKVPPSGVSPPTMLPDVTSSVAPGAAVLPSYTRVRSLGLMLTGRAVMLAVRPVGCTML